MPQKPLIEKLDITHFRGLHELSLDNLSHVNVLAGVNNCGKTSVLEALMLLSAPYSFRTVTEMALYRVSPSEEQEKNHRIEYIRSMFYETVNRRYLINLSAQINGKPRHYQIFGELDQQAGSFQKIGEVLYLNGFSGEEEISESEAEAKTSFDASWTEWVKDGEDYKYKFSDFSSKQVYDAYKGDDKSGMGYHHHPTEENDYLKRENTLDTFYLPATQANYYRIGAKLMFNILRGRKKRDILEVMRIFAPHVEGFYIPWEEDLYLEQQDGSLLPLYAYGYGMQKAVALASVTLNMENGVLLIDEIENSVHMSAFEEVFLWCIML